MTFAEQPSKSPTLRLRITPTAEWKVRSGHPWIFSDSIKSQNRDGISGELAVIYDRWDNFLAIGLFDPRSPLRVRVLHVGKAQTLDEQWWRERLDRPLAARENLFGADTTGYRCIHGESDGWPGLVLDRYGDTYVLKLYSGIWLPRIEELRKLLVERLGSQRIVLRVSRNTEDAAKRAGFSNGSLIAGEPLEGPVEFLENGLRFEADVLRGQKTGFFLDQRENRKLVGDLARGRTLLNAFSYSGGFSVYAARGGARAVTDVDISAHALEAVTRNFELNRSVTKATRRETVKADVFEWLKTAGMFDLVILDPPSFAKREAERAGAMEAYARLARLGIRCVEPGGFLVAASCSAHVTPAEFFGAVREAGRQSGRRFQELQTTGHPADHPASFPEAAYLKCIYLELPDNR